MTYEGFNAFCRALPATTYVVQWGGSHVWKVGGKVFAIGGWRIDEPSFTFKVSDIAYEMLKERLASRALSGIARDEMDPAFRKARTVRWRVAGLYPPITFHCRTGLVEEETERAGAQLNPTDVVISKALLRSR